MIPTGMEVVKERERLVISKEASIEAYKAFTWSDYYPQQWKSKIEEGKGSAGFNFSAFLLTYRWCFFRKLNKLGLILFIVESLILAAGLISIRTYQFEPIVAIFAVTAGIFTMMIFTGFYANSAYFNHARKQVESYINSRIPEIHFGEALRSDGGTSIGNVLIFIALNGFITSLPKLGLV
ncbi:DUF2628 domain-containing protein [Photobacterium sp. GB-56]|uniref:DUF2628 domain-containing protein n=1 Tax=Photobacterium sp. GB-56 TaxID=2022106 RepID=UPI000D1827AE|nr:DUF2628 domain-containing protein [Photobacterium sp. GB-56]PSV27372.1 hypothetical protein C9J42_06975 [Photobacterium sp. GB-56]